MKHSIERKQVLELVRRYPPLVNQVQPRVVGVPTFPGSERAALHKGGCTAAVGKEYEERTVGMTDTAVLHQQYVPRERRLPSPPPTHPFLAGSLSVLHTTPSLLASQLLRSKQSTHADCGCPGNKFSRDIGTRNAPATVTIFTYDTDDAAASWSTSLQERGRCLCVRYPRLATLRRNGHTLGKIVGAGNPAGLGNKCNADGDHNKQGKSTGRTSHAVNEGQTQGVVGLEKNGKGGSAGCYCLLVKDGSNCPRLQLSENAVHPSCTSPAVSGGAATKLGCIQVAKLRIIAPQMFHELEEAGTCLVRHTIVKPHMTHCCWRGTGIPFPRICERKLSFPLKRSGAEVAENGGCPRIGGYGATLVAGHQTI